MLGISDVLDLREKRTTCLVGAVTAICFRFPCGWGGLKPPCTCSACSHVGLPPVGNRASGRVSQITRGAPGTGLARPLVPSRSRAHRSAHPRPRAWHCPPAWQAEEADVVDFPRAGVGVGAGAPRFGSAPRGSEPPPQPPRAREQDERRARLHRSRARGAKARCRWSRRSPAGSWRPSQRLQPPSLPSWRARCRPESAEASHTSRPRLHPVQTYRGQ